MNYRERLKDKKRIVIKIGSSSLTHSETGRLNLRKLEVLARELSDLRNQGKDVILVSSGAIATGVAALGMYEKYVPQAVREYIESRGDVPPAIKKANRQQGKNSAASGSAAENE